MWAHVARCRDAGRGAQPCRAPGEPAAGPMKLLLLHTPVPAQLFFPFPSFSREINLFGKVCGRQRAMAGVQPGLWEPNPPKKLQQSPPGLFPQANRVGARTLQLLQLPETGALPSTIPLALTGVTGTDPTCSNAAASARCLEAGRSQG